MSSSSPFRSWICLKLLRVIAMENLCGKTMRAHISYQLWRERADDLASLAKSDGSRTEPMHEELPAEGHS
jgi:hypothetical protein